MYATKDNVINVRIIEREATMAKRIIQIEEKVPLKMLLPLSVQHLFAMFGATVLVPFLFGIKDRKSVV